MLPHRARLQSRTVDRVFMLMPIIYDRICPEQIAQQTMRTRFLEAIEAMKVFEGDEFWGDATVYAEEAAVDEGSDWQCTEGLYACIVNSCRIFVETFALEREIACQVFAFVVATKQRQLRRIPKLEGIKI
jgi:hypothetical protein